MKYWIRKLSGCQFDNFFPIDKIQFNGYEEKVCDYIFSEEVSNKLMKIAKGQELSLYIIIVSAIKIVIHDLIGEDEVMLVSPVYKEQESNTEYVILRDFIKDSMSFKDVIMAVKNTITEAYMNQEYSYKEILSLFEIEEDSAIYNLVCYSEQLHCDLSVESKEKIGLRLKICHQEERIRFEVYYNQNAFYDETITMLFRSIESIFLQVIGNINSTVEELEILSTFDRDVYQKVNGNVLDENQNATIIEGFKKIVRKYSESIALIFKDYSMTYGELDQKSNQVANSIVTLINQKGSRIGIMANRGFSMIIGMFGILKAGAAYVPIDSTYPQNRIQYIMENSDCNLLLIQEELSDKVPKTMRDKVITIEAALGKGSREPIDYSSLSGLAYMIYTSGTTGLAKGVMIEHQTIMNTLNWWNTYYDLKTNACVLQIPSFSFDSSVENIFATLLAGGKLVLIEDNDRFDMKEMSRAIVHNKVNHILAVPSYYRLLMEQCEEALASLYSVTLAGEKFDRKLVEEHMERFPKVKLYNEYGPTENSVCSTVYLFSKENTKVLIGRPIFNTECFIMKKNKVLPIGVVGELCVSGKGLSRGYYKNEELTNQKFVKNSMSKYGKVYHTGDIARILQDGNIEYCGREDTQIKIRGFRIELGEIEENIKKLNGISEATVICVGDELEEKTLHAFVVAKQELDQENMKIALKKLLPYYMVPAKIMQVNKLPLNANGKIDQKKLLQLEMMEQTANSKPATQLEQELAIIWSEVLKIENEEINVVSDFESNGGNSIYSIVILDRIEKKYALTISLSDFYEDNSIRKLAKVIEERVRLR